MLGNGARFLGPSAGSTNNINNQHQTQFNRSIWPTATTFQANGSECKSKTFFFGFFIHLLFHTMLNSSPEKKTNKFFILSSITHVTKKEKKECECNNNSQKVPECLHEFQTKHFCTLLMQTKCMQALTSLLCFFTTLAPLSFTTVSMNAFEVTRKKYICYKKSFLR